MARTADAATVRLAWDAAEDPAVTGYVVLYGTASRVYVGSVDTGAATTYDITGLTDGQQYYFAVQSYTADGTRSDFSPEVSHLIPAAVPAQITSPAAGAAVGAMQTFRWDAGVGASAYWLDVGTTPGGYDIFHGYVGSAREWTVAGIPLTGGPIWVRLRSLVDGAYRSRDHQFATPSAAARIVSPAETSTLPGPTATFTWDAGIGAQFYWVNVGSVAGGYEYYSNFVGATRAVTVHGLPLDGRPVWVRLLSYINGEYQAVDHRFVAATAAPARLVSPSSGATLDGATQTFVWNSGVGATGYWVNVGSTQGGYEFYSNFVGTSQSLTLRNLPINGRDVWVRLMSFIGGRYVTVDHRFVAARPGPAQLTSPALGSVLQGASQRFEWGGGAGVAFYWVNVGGTQGGYEYYSNFVGATQAVTVTGLPIDGRDVWVRLMSYIDGAYQYIDHRFVAARAGPARITAPAAGAVLSGRRQTFTWAEGVGAAFYWVNIGRSRGGYELYSNFVGATRALTLENLPVDGGPVWVRLLSFVNGAYEAVDHQFSAAAPVPARVVAPAATIAPVADAHTFTWEEGVGVTAYWLEVGTVQGGYELFSNFVGTERSWTVAGIPPGAAEIWVRLYSRIGSRWEFVDQRFAVTR
ncbi:MAG TPA: fibronectin type III domain-containing protein [Vicinamibacterales bacterium]|nr:fibronectin type III domain-containing protein [Vicinamibacterales bacterium]